MAPKNRKTRATAGRAGGKSTLRRHGLNHFAKIGRKGGLARKGKR